MRRGRPRGHDPQASPTTELTLAITFSCKCGASIQVPDVLAGYSGRCPGCEAVLEAPGTRAEARPSGVAAGIEDVRLTTVSRQPGVVGLATKARRLMEFACRGEGCGQLLRLNVADGGKRGRCVHCGHTFVTPRSPSTSPGAAAAAPPQPAPPLTALPQPTPSNPLSARDAIRVVRVDCSCGRGVSAPLGRLTEGKARCPSCDRLLSCDEGHP